MSQPQISDITTIPLKRPIEVDGVRLTALRLRYPIVRDLLMMDKLGKNEVEREIALVALLADLAPETIHLLGAGDYTAVQEVLKGFFQSA